jgi:hypothetical protein
MRASVENLQITQLVHFTQLDNLESILRHGIRPREDMDTAGASGVGFDFYTFVL